MVEPDAFEVGDGPRGDARRRRAAHRRLRADPVHPADPQGARGAAADRAADDQQVLRHRPRRAAQPRRAPRRRAASRSTASPGATPTPGTPTGAWTPTARRSSRRWTPRRRSPRQDQVALLGICSGGMIASMVLGAPRRDRRPRPGGGVQPRRHRARPGAGRAAQRAALAQGGRRLDAGVAREGLPRRPGAGRGLRLAAAQRPDLELLGQQLPAGPRPQGLRHPLLERRPDADDRRDAPRLHGPRDPQRADRAGRGPRMLGTESTSARSTSTPTSSPGSPTTCARGSPATGPPSCSAATRFVLSTSGHIAAMVNPPGNPKASFQTATQQPAGRRRSGSAPRARSRAPGGTTTSRGWPSAPGAERNKPRQLGSAAYEPLCEAPGTYVHRPLSAAAAEPRRDRIRTIAVRGLAGPGLGAARPRAAGRRAAAAAVQRHRRQPGGAAAVRRRARPRPRRRPLRRARRRRLAAAAAPLPDRRRCPPGSTALMAKLGPPASSTCSGCPGAAGSPSSSPCSRRRRVRRRGAGRHRHRLADGAGPPARAGQDAHAAAAPRPGVRRQRSPPEIYGGTHAHRPRARRAACCTRPPAPGPKRGYYYQLAAMTGWTQPAVPRPDPAADAGAGRRRRPDHPGRSTPGSGAADPRRPAARLPRRAPRHPHRGRRAGPGHRARSSTRPRRGDPHERAGRPRSLEDSPFSDFLGFELLLEERGPRAAAAACARS